jgi:TM2 domain-containing membrane protein YozV
MKRHSGLCSLRLIYARANYYCWTGWVILILNWSTEVVDFSSVEFIGWQCGQLWNLNIIVNDIVWEHAVCFPRLN